MRVIPQRSHVFQDRQRLLQFLSHCHQVCLDKHQPQLVSISLRRPPLDPLAVLHHFYQPQQRHFYLEQRGQSLTQTVPGTVAIAALDTAVSAEFSGSQRFQQAQNFVQTCLAQMLQTGDCDGPYTGPHFFCSFTFFDQVTSVAPALAPAIVFLPRWQVSTTADSTVIVCNLHLHPDADLALVHAQLWSELQGIEALAAPIPWLDFPLPNTFQLQRVAEPDAFQQAVQTALAAIAQAQVHKVVLAHALDVTSPLPFHLVYSLNNLRRCYPDCAIFSVGNDQGQQFIGASPERLLSIHHQQLITDALAGSAPRGQTPSEDAALADRLFSSHKERREHELVVQFIGQQLQSLGLHPQPAPAPGLMQLSNIQHLHTPIQAALPTQVHPLQVVAALHPTPAVAGVPQHQACDYIRQSESFERSLYAAPLGWLDHQGNSEFIVGIRSALIEGNQARLYAGAGIVAGSDPARELTEIQLKLQALLRTLV